MQRQLYIRTAVIHEVITLFSPSSPEPIPTSIVHVAIMHDDAANDMQTVSSEQ